MAEPQPGQWDIEVDTGSGSKDRATVALVSEQVKSVERLVDKGFTDLQRQLDSVAGLPERVTRLEERVKTLDKNMSSDEQRASDVSSWKRGAVTAASLAAFGTLINVLLSTHVI